MKNEIIDYTFNPDEELLNFADFFSKNWGILSTMDFSFSQDINPNYTSDNGKYKIMYFDKIYEYFDGCEPKTNMRVGLTTGIIQISKSKLIKYETNPDSLFFQILWCTAEKEIKNQIVTDKIVFDYYKTTGRSIKNFLIGYIKSLKNNTNQINTERVRQLMKLGEEYKQEKLKRLL